MDIRQEITHIVRTHSEKSQVLGHPVAYDIPDVNRWALINDLEDLVKLYVANRITELRLSEITVI